MSRLMTKSLMAINCASINLDETSCLVEKINVSKARASFLSSYPVNFLKILLEINFSSN